MTQVKEIVSKRDVMVMVSEAHAAGTEAAQKQLDALRGQGPQYQVVDEANPNAHLGDPGWQMLDLCGFGWVHIDENGNSRKMRLLREVLGRDCYKSYYGGWDCFHANVGRQEVSVNLAYARAAAEVLKSYGYKAYAQSRLD
jgi:hypothetical protein